MSILEQNFNSAILKMEELVIKIKEEKSYSGKYIIVRVAYNEDSFRMKNVDFMDSSQGNITKEMVNDPYYKLVFVVSKPDEIVSRFRNKYLFKLAYSDVRYALYETYMHALNSETGEYVLNTSFFKPAIEDSIWAYKDVFHYSDLGNFMCWLNFDDEFRKVDIQADPDFIEEFENIRSDGVILK